MWRGGGLSNVEQISRRNNNNLRIKVVSDGCSQLLEDDYFFLVCFKHLCDKSNCFFLPHYPN